MCGAPHLTFCENVSWFFFFSSSRSLSASSRSFAACSAAFSASLAPSSAAVVAASCVCRRSCRGQKSRSATESGPCCSPGSLEPPCTAAPAYRTDAALASQQGPLLCTLGPLAQSVYMREVSQPRHCASAESVASTLLLLHCMPYLQALLQTLFAFLCSAISPAAQQQHQIKPAPLQAQPKTEMCSTWCASQ
jgi:hypothetical protein